MSVLGVEHVEKAAKNGGVLAVGKGDLVTPLARERARELGVTIGAGSAPATVPEPSRANGGRPHGAPAGPSRPDAPTVNALYRRGAPAPVLPAVGRNGGRPKAAVVGAGHVGSVAALRIAESDLFDEVVLIDIAPGLAAGIALDLWHSAGLSRFSTRLSGSEDVAAAAGADYVVITAGRPRKPGMSRTDLTAVNAEIVGSVAEKLAKAAPDAVLVVVSNPLEEMTHVARLRSGFPPERVLGMAGVLDTARFAALVGLTGKARPDDVHAYALGSHGPEMVVPLSQASVRGRPLRELLDGPTLGAIVERTRDSGAEVVKLLQTGSAYFAPGQSAALMVTTMARGADTVLACAVEPNGEYGLRDTRVGLPVRLGPKGLREIVELSLEPAELEALRTAAATLADRIREVSADPRGRADGAG